MQIEKDILLSVGATVGIMAVFFAFVWMPNHRCLTMTQADLLAVESELKTELVKVEHLSALSDEVKRIESQLKASDKILGSKRELGKLLRTFSTELRKHGISDKSIQTQSHRREADYIVLPVTLSFKGSFDGTFDFLKRLEQLSNPMHINRLSMKRRIDKGEDLIDVRVELNAFFAPQEGG